MAYLLFFSQIVWAAENAPEQPIEDQVNEEPIIDTELTSEEPTVNESDGLGSGNEGDEPETEEEGQPSGRFIPTEAIRGGAEVAFPVDFVVVH